MDLMVDQPSPPPHPQPTPTPTPTPSFKYFCKICNKGFGCGRALGGHMRAHGIGDESLHTNEYDDQAGDWDDKLGGSSDVPPRTYTLRTNPNRSKSCRVCDNCGKEFLSWKSFLKHGKYKCNDVRSLVSSHDYDDEDDDNVAARRGAAKRKRSLRLKIEDCYSKHPISEEEDLANCLMMLSNATTNLLAPEAEESCASASREDYERHNYISYVTPISYRSPSDHTNKAKGVAATRGLFECKACKKVFNSHQALGGHRASHKKVKGCFAARLDNDYHDPNLDHQDNKLLHDEQVTAQEQFKLPSTSALDYEPGATSSPAASKKKSKVHECSICHRIFSSGQALGGHKRCHWITSNAPNTSTSLAKFHQFQDPHLEQQQHQPCQNHKSTTLDLNLSVKRDRAHRLSFELSTEIQLHPPLTDEDDNNKDNDIESKNNVSIIIDDNKNLNSNPNSSIQKNMNATKEDCKVELVKLSDFKDMNDVASSSPWLQVGIGSTSNISADL